MLTLNEKKLIISLVASPIFEALKKVIQERIETIKDEDPLKPTEFETICRLNELKGRKKELEELPKTLELYYKRFSKE